MSWAKRLKRVFGVENEACARGSGKRKVVASIEERTVIAKILADDDGLGLTTRPYRRSRLERRKSVEFPIRTPLGGASPSPQVR
jgi:hypothetical protein